jgi:hypothetical protein
MTQARRMLVVLLATLAGNCARVETQRPVPWFKTRVQHSPTIGGLASGGSSGLPPQVRRFGLFWKELAGCLGGEVLDRETVAVFCTDTFNSGTALIRKGEAAPRPACGSYSSYSRVLADRSAVDCSTMLAGTAPIVPTTLRYWRVAPSREMLFDTTITIPEPGRAFVSPLPRLYDERMRGYFVAATVEWKLAPDCALLTIDSGALTLVAAAPDLRRSDCSDPTVWSRRTGRRLTTG